MSLTGRYIIDRVKRAVSHRLILPCPPYGKPTYWDGVYKKLGADDSFEWAGLRLKEDLLRHRYDKQKYSAHVDEYGYETTREADDAPAVETTFGEAIGVHPGEEEKKIIMLGCGNSKLGEDMIDHGWAGPILQVDVSSKVVSSMTERCAAYVESGRMDMIQDDAALLTAFEDSSVDSVVDKGLVDALFCANEPLGKIMFSMSRVLKPGGVFAFLSFSRPEFLLKHVMEGDGKVRGPKFWDNVEIRELDSILIYRFVKGVDRPKHERAHTQRGHSSKINVKSYLRKVGRNKRQ